MSLHEAVPSKRKKKRSKPAQPYKYKIELRTIDEDDIPRLDDDDQVMSFPDWCKANSISLRTGGKLRAAGLGPTFVQLSAKRIGVTKRSNRLWQAQRTVEAK